MSKTHKKQRNTCLIAKDVFKIIHQKYFSDSCECLTVSDMTRVKNGDGNRPVRIAKLKAFGKILNEATKKINKLNDEYQEHISLLEKME